MIQKFFLFSSSIWLGLALEEGSQETIYTMKLEGGNPVRYSLWLQLWLSTDHSMEDAPAEHPASGAKIFLLWTGILGHMLPK